MFPPIPQTGRDAVLYYMDRQHALDGVDKRLGEFRDQFDKLVDEYNELIEELTNTTGFWAKIRVKNKIKKVIRQLDIIRDLEDTLIEVRYKHT